MINEQKIKEANFDLIEKRTDGAMYRKGNLLVICSCNIENDDKRWWHLSLSRPNRYPPHEEILYIKNLFFGTDKKVIMIFPKKENYINIHKYCFHLFYCVDGDNIPEFSLNGITL
ncbi:MAG: hypothetical protein PVI88_00325 [Nitrosopumilaceae archaeon]|jgi:hypothetical protein